MPTMPTAAMQVAMAVLVNAVVVWMVAYKPVVAVWVANGGHGFAAARHGHYRSWHASGQPIMYVIIT